MTQQPDITQPLAQAGPEPATGERPRMEDRAVAAGIPKERPILFSGPMVRALLDGRKTQTRRVVKGEPVNVVRFIGADDRPTGEFGICSTHDRVINKHVRCPYGAPGDRLWVREAWTKVPATAYRHSEGVQQTVNPDDPDMAAVYAAGWDRSIPKWRPSIHMPRWASRLTLHITDVQVERLNDCSERDALAEGIIEYEPTEEDPSEFAYVEGGEIWNDARGAYRGLWESINGFGSWDANPWVWVVSFEVIR